MNKERIRKGGKNKEGFTLTEILVAVLIAAVVAAIAYPLYTKSVLKARAVEAVNLLEIVKTKQAGRYIVSRDYYASFENMGQLTQKKSKEKINGSDKRIIEIGDYKLVMNDEEKCLTAQYKDKFTFSTGYEDSKIGCSGDICESLGELVEEGGRVCNARDCDLKKKPSSSQSCASGCGTQTRSVECNIKSGEWESGGWRGSCWAPYGAGTYDGGGCPSGYYGRKSLQCRNSCGGAANCTESGCTAQVCTPNGTRTCGSGCGTQTCNEDGSGWEGTCSSPTQTQETSKECKEIDGSLYGGGEASRKCSATCGGGECGEWDKSKCTAITKECTGEKPEVTRDCGNKCGKESGTTECNSATGKWKDVVWSGSCAGEGVCTAGTAGCDNNCQCKSGYYYTGKSCAACPAVSSCSAGCKTYSDISGCPSVCIECNQCVNGSTQGYERCGNCTARTTQRCVNGAWKDSPGTCDPEYEVKFNYIVNIATSTLTPSATECNARCQSLSITMCENLPAYTGL
ncbi:MAG: prepilin-type N-terminal cleavage/methylation domain-containing protein [Elusimicrobiota bacterium]|jgi:prepilin-type N-terminal cleavage/methylation domain-containing protein|nr:prepilin-type N-terminal cleavage/methylation domain-containing protein [Elusimicrobiota bacterium]